MVNLILPVDVPWPYSASQVLEPSATVAPPSVSAVVSSMVPTTGRPACVTAALSVGVVVLATLKTLLPSSPVKPPVATHPTVPVTAPEYVSVHVDPGLPAVPALPAEP